MADNDTLRDYLKLVSADLHRTRSRLREVEDAAREPIAVVGMACRYPGGITGPDELWDLVAAGGDGIGDFPDDRGWDLTRLFGDDPDAGTSYVRQGGFVAGAGEFDPAFFGISPREALAMDPQQRLLLETSWEALEQAGIAADTLRGSRTGVFAGTNDQGYPALLALSTEDTGGHVLTGGATAVTSGRIAYVLGLEGPAVTVDTACSSSLVALHLAAQSLRTGECDLALAGGVTVMSTPGVFTEFSRQRGLASDGRCKSFAAAADGTGWAEGAGVLVVERLSDARRNGHRVLAVVRGSAVNSDGASNGLTAPNGPSQQRVILDALAQARLSPADVDAVDAHGTGTVLGDPIEAQALLATYGSNREQAEPLWVGSVKSNIGHAQSAAGVAGVIKMVQALRHGVLPRTLHVDEPTPHVDWTAGDVRLLTEQRDWPETGRARRGAVSAFGVSGTNAHVILEQAPDEEPPAAAGAPVSGPVVVAFSARTPEALIRQADRLHAALLADPALTPADLGRSLAGTRTALEYRAALVAGDRDELLAGFATLTAGTEEPVLARPGKLAFLFSGQGAQRTGMGRELYAAEPVFAAAFDEVTALLDPHLDRPLRDVVFEGADGELDETAWTQAGLFALEVALARLLGHWGVTPDYLLGHSIGEIAAAHLAGVLSLADACALVAARGRLMGSLPAGGAMLAVRAGEADVRAALEPYAGRAGIAAVNGPEAVVVSGAGEAVTELAAAWEQRGVKTRRLRVSHAFHSVLMEPMLAEFRRFAASLTYAPPRIPVVSNLTGEPVDAFDADYWVRHAREAVRFADGLSWLREHGVTVAAEIGPDGVLAALAAEASDAGPAVIPVLRRGRDERTMPRHALAALHVAGAVADLTAPHGGGGRVVALPLYPFERDRYWPTITGAAGDITAAGLGSTGHALLGAGVTLATGDELLFTARLSVHTHAFLTGHLVHGRPALSTAALIDLAVRAGDRAGCPAVAELTVLTPVVLPDDAALHLQVRVGAPDDDGWRTLTVHSRPADGPDGWTDGPWTEHVTGVLAPAGSDAGDLGDLRVWPPTGAEALPGATGVWRHGEDTYAEVRLDEAEARDAPRYGLHPALLTAALSTLPGDPALAVLATDIILHATGAEALRVRLRPLPADPGSVAVLATDLDGEPVLSAGRLELTPVADVVLPGGNGQALPLLEPAWLPIPATAGDTADLVLAPVIGHPATAAGIRAATAEALDLLHRWDAEEHPAGARLVFVTHGATDAAAGDIDLAGAAVHGLVRSAQTESPGAYQLVDLPADGSGDVRSAAATGEPEVAVRDSALFAARLRRAGSENGGHPVLDPEGPVLDPEGTVLITGGSGRLGSLVARHLVTVYGARHLALAGRRGAGSPGTAELIAELAGLGAVVTAYACDVSDRDDVAALLAALPADRPLTAVFHAAGVVDDGVVASLTPQRLGVVLRPKIDAALLLDELTRDTGLAAFVLFSSLSGLLGGAGQGSYAAANAALDALAARRQAAGLPALSLAWGPWASGGMLAHLAEGDRARMARSGFPPVTDEQGLALLDAALRGSGPVLVPTGLDLARLQAHAAELPPLLSSLVRTPARRTVVRGGSGTGLAALLAGLAPADRLRLVLDRVRAAAAAILGLSGATAVAADRPFRELGLDSLTAVELRNRLAAATGLRLSATLAFDHPTATAVAGHLLAELDGEDRAAPAPAPTATRTTEPVAIVGIGCRFPGGVAGPDEFWQLLADGADAVGALPADRGWDLDRLGAAGYTLEGGFVDGAADFDAPFFSIVPREAVGMDPQQRLLLETSWEAFERAGIDPEGLRGSRTGVYVGGATTGYSLGPVEVPEGSAPYLLTGMATSVLSGRLSYTFGLEGPAVTIDTACSSSLVAMHLAGEALRSGECDLALAGGATVMPTPDMFVDSMRGGALARDGRCKAFAADADGTGWGEGVGVVVLELLSDARRNGHPVLAVLRGSAINHDGASNGLTAPNGGSQQRVIRSALQHGGLGFADVDAVEAHGTGTALGDPIEAQALLETYGRDRDTAQPLRLGSVKSNLGHTQAAAGVAGVIKMIMAMRHGVLPATLHADRPSEHIDWSGGTVRLLTAAEPWPARETPRRAAVSSFGMSGTNAHLILEEAPAEPAAPAARPGPWLLSARTAAALRAQAGRLREFLDGNPGQDIAAIGHALSTTRARMPHRAVLLAGDRDGYAGLLAALAEERSVPGLATGVADPRGKVAFVLPGQGSQWPGMGRALLATEPVFRASVEECDAALQPFLGWSVAEALAAPDDTYSDRMADVQPLLFTLMVSLAALWRSHGLVPDAVVGHSQGETAAAYLAGGLTLRDAAKIVAVRSRMLGHLADTGYQGGSDHGAMVAVPLPVAKVEELLAEREGLFLAAINSPRSVAVSGLESLIDAFTAELTANGVRARKVRVPGAGHSPHIEVLREQTLTELADVRPLPGGNVVFYSSVTGEPYPTEGLDAEYWFRNMRRPVRFAPTVESMLRDGYDVFVESSPHPVLLPAVQDTADHAGTEVTALATLRRKQGDRGRFLLSVATAYAGGVPFAWPALPHGPGPRVALPTYAFQRRRFWLEPLRLAATGAAPAGDSLFWDAVDRADLSALTGVLDEEQTGRLAEALPALASWRAGQQRSSTLDSWRYRISWRPATLAPAGLDGTWLLLTAGGDADGEYAALLGASGAIVVQAGPDADLIALLDPADPPRGVLSLRALDERPHTGHPELTAGLTGTLAALQAVARTGFAGPVWLATRGATAAQRADRVPAPAQAQVWGLGLVAGLELAGHRIGLLDLPAELDARAADRLTAVLGGDHEEDQLAIRAGGVFARRMVRATGTAADAGPWRPHGTVLITGGTGNIGAHVARRLIRDGAERLVLTGRRGVDAPGAQDLLAELRELGADVRIEACDIADRDAVRALLAGFADGPPLTAVVHAAGVPQSTGVAMMEPAEFAGTVRAKTVGATLLDELTGDDLEAFIVFSSGSSVWGSAGQAAYAAANAHLDALCQHRRARGRAALSISWGGWGGGGMVSDAAMDYLGRRGMRVMDPELAVDAMMQAQGAGETWLTVADIDWESFTTAYTATRARPLIDEIPQARAVLDAEKQEEPGAGGGELTAELAGLSVPERRRRLLDLVRTHAAAALGHQGPQDIEPARAFQELGFDSLTAVDIRNRLRTATGLPITATVVFDHPTPARLADHLHAELYGAEADPAPAAGGSGPGDATEPIAIIGMACRFPGGVRTPEDLWELVRSGTDAIGGFPDDRGWDLGSLFDSDPDRRGTTYAREGGFVHDAGDFDAEFFNISPREALATDPQQRMLLETSWEAIERGGIDPLSLAGSRCGVFAGSAFQGYGLGAHYLSEDLEGFFLSGTGTAAISGRVAYALGLEGPAVTVDSACSSAIVSLHLAAQALRSGECDLALAGGVTVLSSPVSFIEFSRQRGLSADGRCKPFAAAADGTVWSEGAGMVLVERLSDAQRLGHPVLAVVTGSAINQDGASNGPTAPNGPSQQRVIRAALAAAGVTPDEVDAVEAHGTGTTLGDPIEAQALIATYGRDRDPARPLYLGSVKSNIGHTTAAGGAAGLIKMVMAMGAGELPRTLHIDEPTPHVDWSAGAVELLTENRPWPATGRPRRAGISSFGGSGTNSHVIIEQPPQAAAPRPAPAAPAGMPPVLLSGRTEAALRAQAGRLRERLTAAPDTDLASAAHALATTRSSFHRRAALAASDRAGLLTLLDDLAAGRPAEGVRTGAAGEGRTVFVYPGQGGQWTGMAAGLLDTEPVFADAVDAVALALAPHLDWSLHDTLRGLPGAAPLERVDVVQPALFAVMVGLTALWRSWGVEPDAVVGHSQGELVAAYVAGALSLDDAATVVAVRARLLREVSGTGGLLSVWLTAERVRDRLAPHPELEIAALNGPGVTVVGGPSAALDAFAAGCGAEDIRVHRVDIDYPSHTAGMEALREPLLAALDGLTPRLGRVPFWSTTEGGWTDTTTLGAGHWFRNLRRPVLFESAVRELAAAGHRRFLEVSPHPVLTVPMNAALDERDDTVVTGSLRRGEGTTDRLRRAAAELHIHGVPVDWTAVLGARPAVPVDLPTYAFQSRRYWLIPSPSALLGDVTAAGLTRAGHPMLGAAVPLADGSGTLLTGRLSATGQPWLPDHAVAGATLLPGTAFIELAWQAGRQTGEPLAVEELTLESPLVLPAEGAVQLQVTLRPAAADPGRYDVTVHARPDGDPDSPWTRHATAILSAAPETPAAVDDAMKEWPPPGATPVDLDGFYDGLRDRGYAYGPAFRGTRALWRRGDEIFAEVELEDDGGDGAGAYGLHPALLDTALHGIAAIGSVQGDAAAVPQLPFAFTGVRLYATGASALRVRLARTGDGVGATLADAAGTPVAVISSLVGRPVPAGLGAAVPTSDALFHVDWTPVAAASPSPGTWLVTGAPAVADALTAAGATVTVADTLAGAVEALAAGAVVDGVVVRPVASVDDLTGATHEALRLAQEWTADERAADVPLVVLTSGAVATGPGERPGVGGAAAWGLLRSAQLEHPGRIVLTDIPETELGRLAQAVRSGEPQTAVRAGRVLAPRLVRARASQTGRPALDADRTVLVTGGTGTLGAAVARHLATEHGVRHLLLTSRRGPSAPGAQELVAELGGLGAEATVAACDTGDRDALAALLAAIPADRPLGAVVHTAGIVDDGVIGGLTPERLDRVLTGKALGAMYLDELTRGGDPVPLVLFSSAAGTLGGAGQANYAAANAALDAIAQRRQADGLPAVSLPWGPWAQATGMTGELTEADVLRVRRAGLRPLPTAEGLALMDAGRADGAAVVVAISFEPGALRPVAGPVPHFMRSLIRTTAGPAGTTTAAHDPGALRERLRGLGEQERRDAVLTLVRDQIAAVLGYASAQEIRVERGFLDLGMDSLTGVELRNRMAAITGLRLPATLVFDHPSPVALARHLERELVPPARPAADEALDQLDALARTLAGVGDDDRERLGDRLRELLGDLQPRATVEIGDASAEELFDFIDGTTQEPIS
ncbi:type I polyketide synthase [Winogradskya consettensis]|uniref:Uncharacterized protein n=1 Tax=Winogradskya consettensis TaxID=113560 RepID=A0A919T2E6_9ACTN|nr:type I polyketide synthase [Actinoplanes consettensis]GIM82401.1 hypothetical protein Aco04nite_81320 [Actinoplanes consettensis]